MARYKVSINDSSNISESKKSLLTYFVKNSSVFINPYKAVINKWYTSQLKTGSDAIVAKTEGDNNNYTVTINNSVTITKDKNDIIFIKGTLGKQNDASISYEIEPKHYKISDDNRVITFEANSNDYDKFTGISVYTVPALEESDITGNIRLNYMGISNPGYDLMIPLNSKESIKNNSEVKKLNGDIWKSSILPIYADVTNVDVTAISITCSTDTGTNKDSVVINITDNKTITFTTNVESNYGVDIKSLNRLSTTVDSETVEINKYVQFYNLPSNPDSGIFPISYINSGEISFNKVNSNNTDSYNISKCSLNYNNTFNCRTHYNFPLSFGKIETSLDLLNVINRSYYYIDQYNENNTTGEVASLNTSIANVIVEIEPGIEDGGSLIPYSNILKDNDSRIALDTSNLNLDDIKYQLKTTKFYIHNYNENVETSSKLYSYYKIGVMSIDGDDVKTENLVNDIKSNAMFIAKSIQHDSGFYNNLLCMSNKASTDQSNNNLNEFYCIGNSFNSSDSDKNNKFNISTLKSQPLVGKNSFFYNAKYDTQMCFPPQEQLIFPISKVTLSDNGNSIELAGIMYLQLMKFDEKENESEVEFDFDSNTYSDTQVKFSKSSNNTDDSDKTLCIYLVDPNDTTSESALI